MLTVMPRRTKVDFYLPMLLMIEFGIRAFVIIGNRKFANMQPYEPCITS